MAHTLGKPASGRYAVPTWSGRKAEGVHAAGQHEAPKHEVIKPLNQQEAIVDQGQTC
jgi:hypothetical protein